MDERVLALESNMKRVRSSRVALILEVLVVDETKLKNNLNLSLTLVMWGMRYIESNLWQG
jgi:hypothetical protein